MVEAEFKSVLGGPKGHALSAESFSTVLPDEVIVNHMWLFKFIKMKESLKLSFSVALPAFQVLSGHHIGTDLEHFHPHRKFCRKVPF